ncbi:MAG TPA: ABC transporter permease [Blastocatellia bacterium]|nr:ABC transporter permease [Blastocatellia bacterium]
MNGLRVFLNRLRAVFFRSRLERELQEEIRMHLEMQTEENRRRGMSDREAHRAALRQFGGVEQVKERYRDRRGLPLIETTLQDLRYAGRVLAKSPAFTAVAVITLALGIGACTAIFSAVNPILFKPLPYPQADRIAMMWDFGAEGSRLYVTFGTYRELTQRSRSFDYLAVIRPWQPTLTGTSEPERFNGQRVSADYFRALGVQPALGRNFEATDDQQGGPRVVILNDALWRRRFGGDPGLVGQQITLDANLYTVIGIMPAGFENLLTPAAEVWTALQYDKTLPPDSREWGHHLRMVGRLREGVGVEQVRREIDSIAQDPVPEFARPPYAAMPNGLMVYSLQDDITGGVRPALLAVVGAVLLVLVIACVNVTNLLLARGAQRRGEFAVRVALGAGRTRLLRQLLTESLLLALIGGVLGMAVAEIGVKALVALSPPGLPRVGAIGVDGNVFAFAFAITALIGLAVGLVPALHASRSDLHGDLQQSSRRTASGHQLTRRVLVVAEVALALVLLVGAGLLLRSMQRLFAIDPGFDTSHLLTLQVQTAGQRFNAETTHRFFEQSLDAVRQLPGVTAAAFTSQLPLSGDLEDGYGVHFEWNPSGSLEAENSAFRYAVSPGYFEAMGIPLRRGRLLDEHDTAAAPPVVVISESLAQSKFLDQNPLGQRLRIGPNEGPWFTIVGVVGNVRQTSLAVDQTAAVYVTAAQWQLFFDRAMWLVMRAQGDAAALAPAARRAVWSVDKDQPIVRAATMNDLLNASAAVRRFALTLFEAFGVVALILAGVGIYGVLAGSVSERVREIGIRLALGASRRDILTLVVRQGMTLTGFGVVIGLSGAVAASQALVSLLFGISRLDPLTYLGVVMLLAGVSALACWVPAWRAARVDPAITLRAE